MRESTGTVTADGYVLHAEVATGAGILRAPVKLARAKDAGTRAQRKDGLQTRGFDPIPLRQDGRLVYALPGGGEWIE